MVGLTGTAPLARRDTDETRGWCRAEIHTGWPQGLVIGHNSGSEPVAAHAISPSLVIARRKRVAFPQ
jgi:hypothetical protein